MKTVALILVLLSARLAVADPADAKAFVDKGSAAYKQQHFTEALVMFQRAYRESPDPALLFNIAECERQLGSFETAARSYRQYVEKSPDAANRDEATQLAAQMDEAALAAQTKPAPAAVVAPPLVSAPLEPERTPIYKKWWAWTAVGAVVVGAIAIGVGVGVARYNATPTASTALGTTRVQ